MTERTRSPRQAPSPVVPRGITPPAPPSPARPSSPSPGGRKRCAPPLSTAIALLAALWLASPLAGCKRQHYPVGSVDELGYPSCPGGDGEAKLVADRKMRSGTGDTRQTIVERFRIEQRGCLWAVTERQEWPMQIADVEALYDEQLRPLRIWRRITAPGSHRPDGMADIKRFDLRTPSITVKHRGPDGKVDFEELRFGRKPEALVGPGRGMVSMWLRKAKLAEGQKERVPVLDFRGVEKISDITLKREPDTFVEGLGRKARVYTFLGRETVFADDDDLVLGDLAGLVPDDKAPGQAPVPMPTYQPIDPRGTP